MYMILIFYIEILELALEKDKIKQES